MLLIGVSNVKACFSLCAVRYNGLGVPASIRVVSKSYAIKSAGIASLFLSTRLRVGETNGLLTAFVSGFGLANLFREVDIIFRVSLENKFICTPGKLKIAFNLTVFLQVF